MWWPCMDKNPDLDAALSALRIRLPRRESAKADIMRTAEMLSRCYLADAGHRTSGEVGGQLREHAEASRRLKRSLSGLSPHVREALGRFDHSYHDFCAHLSSLERLSEMLVDLSERWPAENVGPNVYRWLHRKPDATLANEARALFVEYRGEFPRKDPGFRRDFERFGCCLYMLTAKHAGGLPQECPEKLPRILGDCARYWARAEPINKRLGEISAQKFRIDPFGENGHSAEIRALEVERQKLQIELERIQTPKNNPHNF